MCLSAFHIPRDSVVKNPPANSRDPGSTPGSRRSQEKEMTAHSNILAWKIPWTEEPGGATVHGVEKESDTTEGLNNKVTQQVRDSGFKFKLDSKSQTLLLPHNV